jgi:hypothetical protein
MTRTSFERGLSAAGIDYGIGAPSAVIGLFPIMVPLFSVSSIGLSASYHLPPIGAGGDRVLMSTHDDQITISAVLPGRLRFTWKESLERLSEVALGVNPLQAIPGNTVTAGLQLWTSMTLRSDIYIQSLSFTASAQKRKVLDVSLTLVHLPRPGLAGQLLAAGLDIANAAVSTGIDPLLG